MNSDFNWTTHIDKISVELKKRIGLLKRIKNRVPRNKLVIISESIFEKFIKVSGRTAAKKKDVERLSKGRWIWLNTQREYILKRRNLTSLGGLSVGFVAKSIPEWKASRSIFSLLTISVISVTRNLR